MTFSLIARCTDTGHLGVAAVTAMPAVGKLLTHAISGVGVVATQARINPYLGIDGVKHLEKRLSVEEARRRLVDWDPRADLRQVALLDAAGNTAAWTGANCPHWAGHIEQEGLSAQGNRLAGRHVLESAVAAFDTAQGKGLDERFMEALEAGVAAGGDKKGHCSATIYIMATEEYPLWDIRVDQHDDPIAELRRLHDIFSEKVVPQIQRMPTRENPAGDHGEEVA